MAARRLEELALKKFPTLAEWKAASSVTLAVRAKDPVLMRIDALVESVNKAADYGEIRFLECDLFFVLDYWLKVSKQSSTMEKGREPAVLNLYKFVAYDLCDTFHCEINILPRELEFYFGREMSAHGTKLDSAFDCAHYLKRAELRKYQLYFKNGRAYQFPWWKKKGGGSFSPSKFELANSRNAYNQHIFEGPGRDGWGGFSMSMSRDIYMAKHHCLTGHGANGNFYHSSYLAGQHVMCAGTMKIVDGEIKAISTDSGHYQPDDRHVVNLLQALQMCGVQIGGIEVQDYSGNFLASGQDLMANHGNWAGVLKRRKLNVAHVGRNLTANKAWEDSVLKLWKQGLSAGIFNDNDDGRIYFVGTLLPYYTTWDKSANKGKGGYVKPYSGVNYNYALTGLQRALRRPDDYALKYWSDQWATYLKATKGKDDDLTRRKFARVYHSKTGWEEDDILGMVAQGRANIKPPTA